MNKAQIIGRLGADPEMRHTQNQTPVCELRIATDYAYKDKNGQQQKQTEWHRIVAWNKLAELCNEYLAKGRQVYIEGRIQTRQWEDRDGNKRYTTEIVAQTVEFLGSKNDNGGGRQSTRNDEPSSGGGFSGSGFDDFPDDDVPF